MIGFIGPFRILDYLERLKIVKETANEYHCLCPVCGDGGFKVNKKQGSYQAFKCGCSVKEIREAVRPWSEARETGRRGAREKGRQTTKSSPKNKSSNLKIKLAQLASPATDLPQAESKEIPQWQQKQGIPATATQTRYWYSKTQWVSRFEWTTSTRRQRAEGRGQKDFDQHLTADSQIIDCGEEFEPRTKKVKQKTIRQGHIKSNGLVEWKKGSKDWRAYRLSEAVKHCAGKWVLAVEGEGCVETARAIALCAITWQGSNWKVSRIVKDLTILIEAQAAGLVYVPDRDSAGEKKAEVVLSACQEVDLPCLILSPEDVWNEMPEKGDITDWVSAHFEGRRQKAEGRSQKQLVAQLDRAIASAIERAEQEKAEAEEAELLASLPNWSQSDLAEYLAEKYQSSLAWNVDEGEWYRYSSFTSGIWNSESAELIGQLVKSEIKAIANQIAKVNNKKPTYTISFINGVTALLKLDLAVRRWNEAEGLLPLLNGVLDLETKELLPHSPENKLTWCLPYEYNPLASCQPIQSWLLTMCGGDRQLVELMRAYLLGIVTGRTDWQKYLELVGAGGTGKSTFTRLATALVGQENVHTTTLKKLEKSKFETASIARKRLVLINDSERYAGEVGKLKNLTGQDTLPCEVKFKQSKGGFNPNALVIVTTNEVIQSCDYTSGLARRRISVPMFNKIEGDRQKNLIEHKNGKMYGDFLPYIPGLLNWVLEMDESSATAIVKNYEVKVPTLLAQKAKTLVETNPIADWLDNFVVYDAEARTNVGVAKRDKDGLSPFWFLDTDKWLYPNYCEYCHNSGTKAVSLRRFVNLLSDLALNQLGLNLRKERDRSGSYFVGLKIRPPEDDSPPIVTGNSEVATNTSLKLSNTSVINRLWTMVMDKVSLVIDSVMNESIEGNECDGCDGKNEKSLELENNVENQTQTGGKCNTRNEPTESKKETLDKVSQVPSPNRPEQASSQLKQQVTENKSTIMVGDRVEVEDCPGHWSWASPFTVEAIDGEWAKLEMVGELVEVSRLSAIA